MAPNKADAIFHPVRIRVVQALFGGRRLTAHQLSAETGGTPPATLYRHLHRLLKAGVISVVEERPVRGTVERVYALAHDGAANFSAEELRRLSPDQHVRHFTNLVGCLLGDFRRYVGQERFDTEADGAVVRQESLLLTDAEARQLGGEILAVLAPYLRNAEDPSRRRRMLTTVLLPVVPGAEGPNNAETSPRNLP